MQVHPGCVDLEIRPVRFTGFSRQLRIAASYCQRRGQQFHGLLGLLCQPIPGDRIVSAQRVIERQPELQVVAGQEPVGGRPVVLLHSQPKGGPCEADGAHIRWAILPPAGRLWRPGLQSFSTDTPLHRMMSAQSLVPLLRSLLKTVQWIKHDF